MTRDELESVIWKHAPLLASDEPSAVADAVDAVLAAADKYAVHTAGITADRRQELTAAPPKTVHFLHPVACRTDAVSPMWTGNADRVTCARCKYTNAYRDVAVR